MGVAKFFSPPSPQTVDQVYATGMNDDDVGSKHNGMETACHKARAVENVRRVIVQEGAIWFVQVMETTLCVSRGYWLMETARIKIKRKCGKRA